MPNLDPPRRFNRLTGNVLIAQSLILFALGTPTLETAMGALSLSGIRGEQGAAAAAWLYIAFLVIGVWAGDALVQQKPWAVKVALAQTLSFGILWLAKIWLVPEWFGYVQATFCGLLALACLSILLGLPQNLTETRASGQNR